VSRRRWLVVGSAIGLVVAINLAAWLVNSFASQPGGPRSSSYATAPEGLAAYAELLRRTGHDVVRTRQRPSKARLDPAWTVVVLDPRSVPIADLRALATFVHRGGRLIAGGHDPMTWFGRPVLESPPQWSTAGIRDAKPLAPTPEVAGVRSVRTAGEGSWVFARSTLPVLGAGTRSVVTVAEAGGRVELLADSSLLQNRLLSEADNAVLGLDLAGPASRRVAFLESAHGYGPASGLAAVPISWRWALGGLALAALLLIWARGRRLGPPEREARELPPPRRAYAEALAATLAKTSKPAAALAPLQAAVRERLTRRTGLPADADVSSLRQAARVVGLPEDEMEAALATPADRLDVLALGRGLARLERRGAAGGRGGTG
jgi:hypothetical protein